MNPSTDLPSKGYREAGKVFQWPEQNSATSCRVRTAKVSSTRPERAKQPDIQPRLARKHPLSGAVFRDKHEGNPHGWYIHPHFMTFFKSDLEAVRPKLPFDISDILAGKKS